MFHLLSSGERLENLALVDHYRANDLGDHLKDISKVVGRVVDPVTIGVLQLCCLGHKVMSHQVS